MPRALDVVLDTLYKDSGSKGVSQLSVSDVMERCQLSRSTVRRALQQLKADNVIDTKEGGVGRGNKTVYKVLKAPGRAQRHPRSLGASPASLVSLYIGSGLGPKRVHKRVQKGVILAKRVHKRVHKRVQKGFILAKRVHKRVQKGFILAKRVQKGFIEGRNEKKRPFSSPSFSPLEPPSSTPSSSPEKREKRGPVPETITANRLVDEPNESQNRAFLEQKTKALQRTQRKIGRNKRRMSGLDRAYQRWKAKALNSGLCPTCGLVIDRFDIEEGMHNCVKPFRDRDNDLATERERLEIELWEAQRAEEKLLPVADLLRGVSLQSLEPLPGEESYKQPRRARAPAVMGVM